MGDLQHGLTAYANGLCRCDKCRKAWALYSKMRRRRLRKKLGRSVSLRARAESFYAGQRPFSVRLSDLSIQILTAAEQRSGEALDDLVERIVREAGPAIA